MEDEQWSEFVRVMKTLNSVDIKAVHELAETMLQRKNKKFCFACGHKLGGVGG